MSSVPARTQRWETGKPVLVAAGIGKSFPGVIALEDVDFELLPGEVHALVGENGAGKSTLMKILSGVHPPSAGELWIRGERIEFAGPLDAQKKGVAIIHQEFNLFPNLSAAENIFLDRPDFTDRFGRIKWREMHDAAEALVRSIGADFDVGQDVQYLSVHSQQVLEIAKAISFNADVLIMDEPSAALPENEVQNMFRVVRELKSRGVAIVYVSHRLNEIFQIADRVTILRDGRKVSTRTISETSPAELVHMMIGKEVGNLYGAQDPAAGGQNAGADEIVLKVDGLELNRSHRVSFSVHKGEVLGLFGLVGSGTRTVAERLFGLARGDGRIEVDGRRAEISSPPEAIRHGIAYVPGDRHRQGLVKQMTVLQNVSMAVLPRIAGLAGWIASRRERQLGDRYRTLLNIRTPSLDQIVELLSGGNQQKIVLAKWLAMEPRVLILEEPTRGVDIGAKQEIYRIIRQITRSGFGIILISSEMPEVVGMSDRILVMRNGEFVVEFGKGEFNQTALLQAASSSAAATGADVHAV